MENINKNDQLYDSIILNPIRDFRDHVKNYLLRHYPERAFRSFEISSIIAGVGGYETIELLFNAMMDKSGFTTKHKGSWIIMLIFAVIEEEYPDLYLKLNDSPNIEVKTVLYYRELLKNNDENNDV